MNNIIYSVLLILFITAKLYVQNGSEKQFITIIPGEQYKAGWFQISVSVSTGVICGQLRSLFQFWISQISQGD